MENRYIRWTLSLGLLLLLAIPVAWADYVPAKDGDGCFDFTGVYFGSELHEVPVPPDPPLKVLICKNGGVTIRALSQDGDFFGDPIPDVFEDILYYRWEVDGELPSPDQKYNQLQVDPQNTWSNDGKVFLYYPTELTDPDFWTYGDHTLTCYARDPLPGEAGYMFADDPPIISRQNPDQSWTGWDKKLDITVSVMEPHCSLEFVKPSGGQTLCATALTLFKLKTRCTWPSYFSPYGYSIALTVHENTSEHPVEDVELLWEYTPVSTEYDEDTGITTTTYRCVWNTTEFHNGSHTLSLYTTYPYEQETREATASVNVNIMNLAISSVTPEGVVAWKGEGNPAIPISV